MIKSFRCKETKAIFERKGSKRFSTIQEIILRKILFLEAAEKLEDLLIPPANRLEKLRGNRAGQYSIRVNNQWRLCFKWKDGLALDVEVVDYH